MGSFSAWHLLLLLIIVAAPISLIVIVVRRARLPSPEGVQGPHGFGGWLFILAAGQTLVPLFAAGSLIASLPGYPALLVSQLPNARPLVYAEIGLFLVLIAIESTVTVAMYRRKRYFRELFQWQYLALSGFGLADAFLVSTLLEFPIRQVVTEQDIGRWIGIIIGQGVWLIYVLRSVRVRNTFIR